MDDAGKHMKKDGFLIYHEINHKICKNREDMKLILPKINEMENAISELICE